MTYFLLFSFSSGNVSEESFKQQLELSSINLSEQQRVDRDFMAESLNFNIEMAKCLISQGLEIPTRNIKQAEENLRLRELDLSWVNHLKMTMQISPLASYTPWAVVVLTDEPPEAVLDRSRTL